MASTESPTRLATAADLFALPEKPGAELIDGVIVYKPSPSFEHGGAQAGLAAFVRSHFGHGGGGPGPGGWWIGSEVDIWFEPTQIFRPDLAGWKRANAAGKPAGFPVRIRPDWVCEVLSPSNPKNDLVNKLRVYPRHGVGHYWLVDPDAAVLTVYRGQAEGFLNVLTATRGETVKAEPFDAVELRVGTLFGDD